MTTASASVLSTRSKDSRDLMRFRAVILECQQRAQPASLISLMRSPFFARLEESLKNWNN